MKTAMGTIYINERAKEVGAFTIENRCTVRKTAENFGISKTTVHKDVRERLPLLNPEMAKQVDEIIKQNIDERYYRGGEATKRKYLYLKNKQ